MRFSVLLFAIILMTFNSCKIVHSLHEMKRTTAKIYSYKIDDKDIQYIPMHHLGKKEFYDDVRKNITDYKSKGYTVYYEEISTKLKTDSVTKDIIQRKVRKIKGFSGSFEDATKGTSLAKYVQQPNMKLMGISESDVRADIDYLQFINEWEKQHGKIILDSMDMNTRFDMPYSKGTFYTNSQYKRIVVEYRNQYLLDLIRSGKDNKILMIYGEGHRKNFSKIIGRVK